MIRAVVGSRSLTLVLGFGRHAPAACGSSHHLSPFIFYPPVCPPHHRLTLHLTSELEQGNKGTRESPTGPERVGISSYVAIFNRERWFRFKSRIPGCTRLSWNLLEPCFLIASDSDFYHFVAKQSN